MSLEERDQLGLRKGDWELFTLSFTSGRAGAGEDGTRLQKELLLGARFVTNRRA